jgi:hypothetical protein
MERFLRTAFLAVVAVAVAVGGDARAQKSSASVVKATVTADKIVDGKQVVTITLAVDKGWHLYANPVGYMDFVESQTSLTITGKARPEDVKVEYPAGKERTDKIGNEKIVYKVYEDTVTIKATVQRAKDDTGPLEVVLKFQACSDKQCLLPATVKVPVP